MKQTNNENAANRTSYVGDNYTLGERLFKGEVLKSLPKGWSKLHEEGYIHIHDLDAYGQTYNCITFDLSHFDYEHFKGKKSRQLPISIIQYFEAMVEDYGNEQSGGMAFANWDCDLADILTKLGFDSKDEASLEILSWTIREFILWCNNNHTRMGLTSYYVTLNLGFADTDLARYIARATIENFRDAGDLVYKPNIVFKVYKGVNRYPGDRNYDLLVLSLKVTAKKMIPTYLLCDCEEDRNTDPRLLSIMGCRTRVVDDLYGKNGAIGRGNIDNISINLSRIALEIDKEYRSSSLEEKMETFRKRWADIASVTKDILLDRYKKVCAHKADDFPENVHYKMWCEDFSKADSLADVFKHGTLSIGFIGLSEAMEVLSGRKYWSDQETYMYALGFVKYMREYCDFLRREYKLNFSLLATSGELISGRFTKIDSKLFEPQCDIFSKGYYTNSFHVDVDSGLPAYKKLQTEGLFHVFCNGGSISYIELNEAPLDNDEGLDELVEIATNSGVHYLGINFPKDICNHCGTTGVFDECPTCHSKDITRIRRVSGYLEILDGFTDGKKAEVKNRRGN